MEKCDHSSLFCVKFWDIDGYYATCLACGFYVTGKTTEEVNEQLLPKEKPMTADYDAGYKAGVNAALDLPIRYIGSYTAEFVKKTVETQRKKLLTKKVTRYAIVCSRSRGEGQARAYFVYDDLYEGKNCADADAEQLRKAGAPVGQDFRVHGVFPIEIEIPL